MRPDLKGMKKGRSVGQVLNSHGYDTGEAPIYNYVVYANTCPIRIYIVPQGIENCNPQNCAVNGGISEILVRTFHKKISMAKMGACRPPPPPYGSGNSTTAEAGAATRTKHPGQRPERSTDSAPGTADRRGRRRPDGRGRHSTAPGAEQKNARPQQGQTNHAPPRAQKTRNRPHKDEDRGQDSGRQEQPARDQDGRGEEANTGTPPRKK